MIINLLEDQIFHRKDRFQLRRKFLPINQITDANPDPIVLVDVARSDAAFRRADFFLRAEVFIELVDQFMIRHHDVRAIGNSDRARVNPARVHRVNLVEHNRRIKHHAVADHAKRLRTKNARRQQTQFIFFAVDRDGVTGIGAALETNDNVGARRKVVDDFALALVAPLRAGDYHC